jgi:6-phosphogluconolactonase (cycloisomerase 2 family)
MRIDKQSPVVFIALMLVLLLIPSAFGFTTPRFAFVANEKDSTVSIYTVNATSGLLRSHGYVLVGTKPVAETVTPNGKFLYLANSSSSNVSAFYSINAGVGALTLVGTPIAGGSAPWSITADVTGPFVYMTNNDATVDGYAIDNATGGLTKLTGSPFSASGPSRGSRLILRENFFTLPTRVFWKVTALTPAPAL